jgi:diguanylate cyclase
MVFFKKRDPEQRTLQEITKEFELERKESVFLLNTVRAALVYVRDFSMELAELEAPKFREDLEELSVTLSSDASLEKRKRAVEREKDRIEAFIEQQKKLIQDRERELQDIISLLTRAVATIDAENEIFNRRVFDQSSKIKELARLDDIRQLKSQLEVNVTHMRQTIEQKQEKDKSRIRNLSSRVATLNEALEQARSASQMDALTRVSNRRAFDETIRSLVERNTADPIPFALFLLDIDNFKSVNDTYGHQVGDRVLLATAQLCKGEIRSDDFIGRYGGEEFAIILTGLSLRQAKKKGEKICSRISAARYRVETQGTPETISFTVSIGVSVHRETDTVESIIERADKALYLAKKTGKNRVCSEKDLS